MIVYRLARAAYADLSGEGAKRAGGRYNPRGISAVYASQSISLALLEVLVHLDKTEVPQDYVVMAIRLPSGSARGKKANELALLANGSPEQYLQELYSTPVLRVRSVIVPQERNYVLLPQAREFSASIEWIKPLRFDERLFLALNG